MNFCVFVLCLGREEPEARGHGGECLPGSRGGVGGCMKMEGEAGQGLRDWLSMREDACDCRVVTWKAGRR